MTKKHGCIKRQDRQWPMQFGLSSRGKNPLGGARWDIWTKTMLWQHWPLLADKGLLQPTSTMHASEASEQHHESEYMSHPGILFLSLASRPKCQQSLWWANTPTVATPYTPWCRVFYLLCSVAHTHTNGRYSYVLSARRKSAVRTMIVNVDTITNSNSVNNNIYDQRTLISA